MYIINKYSGLLKNSALSLPEYVLRFKLDCWKMFDYADYLKIVKVKNKWQSLVTKELSTVTGSEIVYAPKTDPSSSSKWFAKMSTFCNSRFMITYED